MGPTAPMGRTWRSGEAGDDTRYDGSETDESPDDGAGLFEVGNAKAHSSFEENKAHGEGDDGEETAAEEFVGPDEMGDRPGQETEEKQKENGRRSKPPGKPLGSDAEGQDESEFNHSTGPCC
jgi:hypothetical protein